MRAVRLCLNGFQPKKTAHLVFEAGRSESLKEIPVDERYQTTPAVDSSQPLGDYDSRLRNGLKPTFDPPEPKAWSWFADDDIFDQWEQTPDADMGRLMRAQAENLLVVRASDNDFFLLTCDNDSGVWVRHPALVDTLLASTCKRWAKDAIDAQTPQQVAVTRWQARGANRRQRDNTLGSCGRVFLDWERQGKLPTGLTNCHDGELNADRRYIGASNGVIDLDTGTLLAGEAARSKFITRRVPDDFDLQATHPDVDRIFAHLHDDERKYLLDAFSYAVRHGPGKRHYILLGDTNGGKSTVLSMIVAALGSKTTGYGQTINSDSLLVPRFSNPHGHQAGLWGIQDTLVAVANELPAGKRDRLDTDLLKRWDGVADMSIRELGEKQGPARPARATLFIAMNHGQIDRVNIAEAAVRERIKILPYRKLPGQLEHTFAERVRNAPDARRAIVAMIVRQMEGKPKVRGTVHPPPDIPGVADAVEEQYIASIGNLGVWLRDHVRPGATDDMLRIDTLKKAISAEFPPDSAGRQEGLTETVVLNIARELCGLPRSKVDYNGGNRLRAYPGFRLVSDAELAEMERADLWCLTCAGPAAPGADPEHPLCDKHFSNPPMELLS